MPVDPHLACEACLRRRPAVDAVRACGAFQGPLRQAIHRLKFANERYLAVPLAGLLADAWNFAPPSADTLVPVPLSCARERQRGYNQSALLAREAGRLLALPVDCDALVRTRETPPQMGLHREQRLTNLRGAFRADPARVRGRKVCLVDDVSTTGATLAACAAALRQAGATAVFALVLAKTE
jgi:ComF family protein